MGTESMEQEGFVGLHGYDSCCMTSNPHHQMPFLHMLLEHQDPPAKPLEPSSFQLLLRLQEERVHHHQPQPHRQSQHPCDGEVDAWPKPKPRPLELESCVTHASESPSDAMEHHHHQQQEQRQQKRNRQQQPSACCKQEPIRATTPATQRSAPAAKGAAPASGEKRKRKRPRRPARNVEEVESQRMTHIAVERNRRKLMNDHLSCLRSLMPPSFVQRGDQASVIGGAIDFVKQLEQLLQSLLAERRTRGLPSTPGATSPFHDFFTSPQYATYTWPGAPSASPASSSSSVPCSLRVAKVEEEEAPGGGGETAGGVADVEATVVQTHVNLRVLTPRRPGQLLRAIAALEDLHLSVFHLNIASLGSSVFYCLNLKIEEECKLGSAGEIATAAHQIFSFIHSTC